LLAKAGRYRASYRDCREREDVDHVILTPGVAPQTLAAEGWHIAFLISLADWFARVNQNKPNGHLGIGAFNLIRTSLYKEFGGYEALRLSVVDDIKLGRLVRAGGRTRALIGGDDVECHWGRGRSQHDKNHGKELFCGARLPDHLGHIFWSGSEHLLGSLNYEAPRSRHSPLWPSFMPC
jgi:hypothetical protein